MYVQGNFFQNIGSITLFAVIGTAISAFIVGGGIYFLGQVRSLTASVNKSSGVARACSEEKRELFDVFFWNIFFYFT